MNRQTSHSEWMMRLRYMFVLVYLAKNIAFSAQHKPGMNNDAADTLSQFQEERFQMLVLEAWQTPEPFPSELWEFMKNPSFGEY